MLACAVAIRILITAAVAASFTLAHAQASPMFMTKVTEHAGSVFVCSLICTIMTVGGPKNQGRHAKGRGRHDRLSAIARPSQLLPHRVSKCLECFHC